MRGTSRAFITVDSPRISLFTRLFRTSSGPDEREEGWCVCRRRTGTASRSTRVASEGPSSYAAVLDYVLGCAEPDRGTSVVVGSDRSRQA